MRECGFGSRCSVQRKARSTGMISRLAMAQAALLWMALCVLKLLWCPRHGRRLAGAPAVAPAGPCYYRPVYYYSASAVVEQLSRACSTMGTIPAGVQPCQRETWAPDGCPAPDAVQASQRQAGGCQQLAISRGLRPRSQAQPEALIIVAAARALSTSVYTLCICFWEAGRLTQLAMVGTIRCARA